jgi:hypothetical protein
MLYIYVVFTFIPCLKIGFLIDSVKFSVHGLSGGSTGFFNQLNRSDQLRF